MTRVFACPEMGMQTRIAALASDTTRDLEVATATVVGVVVHGDPRPVGPRLEVAARRIAVLRGELKIAARLGDEMPAAGVDLCTKADGKDRSDHSAPDRFRSTRVHRPLTRRIRDVALARVPQFVGI